MSFRLSVTWLKIVSGLTIAVGVVAAFGAADATDTVWVGLFDLLDWPVDGEPASFDERGYQLNAVLGGVMVGWGTLMFLIVTKQFARGDHRLARPMVWSVLAWFVVDSTGSLVAGLPGNLVLNLVFAVLFVPPLRRLHVLGEEMHSENGASRSTPNQTVPHGRRERNR